MRKVRLLWETRLQHEGGLELDPTEELIGYTPELPGYVSEWSSHRISPDLVVSYKWVKVVGGPEAAIRVAGDRNIIRRE